MDTLSAASLPWLDGTRERLQRAVDADRLPHSILLLSMPGLGAEALGNWLSALVLCDGTPRPCGACASCRLLQADSHPDHHRVRLQDDAQQIKIDQIRELIDVLRTSAFRGGRKVGVVEAAETLNAASANAFLKTLEEPTDRTLLLLIARPMHRLPATVASRCLRVSLAPPSRRDAVAWLEAAAGPRHAWEAPLELAGGAPLLARELAGSRVEELDADMRRSLESLLHGSQDVTLLADHWMRSDPGLRIAWLENWITRRVNSELGTPAAAQSGERVRLSATLLKPKIRALFELLDAARELRRFAATGMNVQLALEALLLMFNGTIGIAKSQ